MWYRRSIQYNEIDPSSTFQPMSLEFFEVASALPTSLELPQGISAPQLRFQELSEATTRPAKRKSEAICQIYALFGGLRGNI